MERHNESSVHCVERGEFCEDVVAGDDPDDISEAALRAESALAEPPSGGVIETASAVAGAAPNWPPKWRVPTTGLLKEAKEASTDFGVPYKILLAMIQRESSFNPKKTGYAHALNSKGFAKSYARNRDKLIPGKNPQKLTWGTVFGPEAWKAYSLTMTLPFNIMGVPGGVPASKDISKLFDIRTNIRAGARTLSDYFKQGGGESWDKALKKYNGSMTYAYEVADLVAQLDKAGVVD